jgi:hypothetical protein
MDIKPYKIPSPFKKLSKDLIHKLVKDIEDGSTHIYAAQSNGITVRIFDIWVAQGKIDLEFDNEDSLPAYLVLSLSKIKQNEIKWCREVIKSSDKGHKGAEWTLEHAYWRHYGSSAPLLEISEEIEKFKDQYLKEGVKENGNINSSEEKENSKE